jgi:16S rRNA (guanine527-N7)-methyltransferase
MSHLNQLLEVFRDERLQLPSTGDPAEWGAVLEMYLAEWEKWNGKINLTSETVAEAIIDKHIFDSLHYVRAVKNPQSQVMDIGSGAGFPGIPLKVIFPGLFLTMVESQRKRASFLLNCARKMHLDPVEVVNSRAEALGAGHHEQFDLILFRGVGEVSHCLELAGPYLKMGGRVAFKKDPRAEASHEVGKEGYFMELTDEIPIVGRTGVASKMMLFCKRST